MALCEMHMSLCYCDFVGPQRKDVAVNESALVDTLLDSEASRLAHAGSGLQEGAERCRDRLTPCTQYKWTVRSSR